MRLRYHNPHPLHWLRPSFWLIYALSWNWPCLKFMVNEVLYMISSSSHPFPDTDKASVNGGTSCSWSYISDGSCFKSFLPRSPISSSFVSCYRKLWYSWSTNSREFPQPLAPTTGSLEKQKPTPSMKSYWFPPHYMAKETQSQRLKTKVACTGSWGNGISFECSIICFLTKLFFAGLEFLLLWWKEMPNVGFSLFVN